MAPPPPPPDQVPRQAPAMARHLALTELFQQKLSHTQKGEKIHILGMCQHSHSNPGTSVFKWCEHCARMYQKVDASRSSEP